MLGCHEIAIKFTPALNWRATWKLSSQFNQLFHINETLETTSRLRNVNQFEDSGWNCQKNSESNYFVASDVIWLPQIICNDWIWWEDVITLCRNSELLLWSFYTNFGIKHQSYTANHNLSKTKTDQASKFFKFRRNFCLMHTSSQSMNITAEISTTIHPSNGFIAFPLLPNISLSSVRLKLLPLAFLYSIEKPTKRTR